MLDLLIVRAISTVVAHFLHTEGVTGSNPVSPIGFSFCRGESILLENAQNLHTEGLTLPPLKGMGFLRDFALNIPER
jgi:hypothetical protein